MSTESVDPTESLRGPSDPKNIAERFWWQRQAEHPKSIGPYKILDVLGEGGMGLVYLAEQEKPIHRRVALKVIKLGMDTKQVIARFETEREALALMNHPNVAKVFDAGTTEQGRPYFAMEPVPGIPITEYCDKHRLNTEERLHLFMHVCNAVQHAHQKGIIHRDIKPSNVLVSVATEPRSHEEKGSFGVSPAAAGAEVKVIDFGVAKATQHRLTEQTLFTEQGQLIGTPGYMSPEQAEMTALDIDTRTDVYSLGVLLYELLVGELPFDSNALRQAGLAEIQRIIREVDPPKPSTKFSSVGEASTTIAHKRHTEPRTLARQLRGDLDWIVMKCLEKDRTRRYETANGLALEITRYLNHEPILAGRPSAGYRLRKFVRRNRLAVTALVAITLSMTGGLVGTSVMYFRAQREQVRAEASATAEAEQRKLAEAAMRRADAALKAEIDEKRLAEQRQTDLIAELGRAKREMNKHRQDSKETDQQTVVDIAAITGSAKPNEALIRLRRLVKFLEHEGSIEDAVRMQREIVKVCTTLEDGIDDHPRTVVEKSNLAALLVELGESAEAEEQYREVDRIMRYTMRGGSVFNSIFAHVLISNGKFSDAEPLLVEMYTHLKNAQVVPPLAHLKGAVEQIIYLYEKWDAAEPGKGYAEKAAEWRAKLDETSKSQNIETSKPLP